MTVLGWTRADLAPLPGVASIDLCGLRLLTGGARAPRDRMRAQLDLMDRLATFLPAAPRAAPPVAEALDWTRAHAPALARRLEAVAGAVQISACFPPDAPPASPPGAGWLRARADAQAARRHCADRLLDDLARAGPGLGLRAHAIRATRSGLAVDLLADRACLPALRDALARTGGAARPDLLGPLPVYHFADLAHSLPLPEMSLA